MWLTTFWMLALVVMPLPRAVAQERPAPIEPGVVVRITAPDVHPRSKHVIGTLTSVDSEAIVLTTERDSARLRIPRAAVHRAEVWDPTVRKSATRAVLISAGFAAAVGLGALTIDRAGQSLPEGAKYLGWVLVGAGVLAGPSAPSLYAGNTTAAFVHLGVTAGLAAGFLAAYCPESCEPGEEQAMLLLLGGYAVNWVVGAIDGAIAAGRYRRWVEVATDRIRTALVPLPAGRLGVGVSVRF
jgi:hypothetical protein